ncbi:MAG: Fic family protein [Synergistaceae bacterium]|nr:Fic family protein [Synergistaceae bacterium]
MCNDYAYIDPDHVYTDTGTGVLKNLAGITEQSVLEFFESVAVTKRIKELKNRPVKIKDSTTLLFIHKYLFQDVYSWAGQKRVVEIGKDGKQFFPTVRFETAFSYINSLLKEYWAIKKADKPQIAEKLAVILDAVNYLHPFREGNGRAQREFVRVLALEKGYKLNLNPADNADVYERYMAGTVDGDTDKLAELILEIM